MYVWYFFLFCMDKLDLIFLGGQNEMQLIFMQSQVKAHAAGEGP